MYFTARTVKVPAATFDEAMCKSLIGSQFEGTIVKVPSDLIMNTPLRKQEKL
jgi:hypothetical protein